MSTSKSKLEINSLPDTQGQTDTRNMPINKVGIKDIVHPMIIKQRSGKEQSTIANFNMYVNLPHDFKGTHMSRFVHILNKHEEQITVDSFKKMIDEMLILLEAESGHIEMKFPYFTLENRRRVMRRKSIYLFFRIIFRSTQDLLKCKGRKYDDALYVWSCLPTTIFTLKQH